MAGYISFGPDMPNMGEHFVLPERAVSRELDFSKPSVLCYLKIGGKHVLTGVAYTYPVVQGETPPDLPFDEMSWHYHSGNLQMEAYGITNHPESDNHDPEVRLAMLHAWIWSYNPDGVFTGDHWGLSFERSGLLPPPKIDPDASRALFMTHQGIQYYSRFMKLAIEPDPETYKELQSTLKTHTIKVEDLVSTLRKKQQISSKDQEVLKQIWLDMWADIQKQVTEKEWFIISANLAHIHDH
ncbi:hypothetical protein AB2B38_013655 [Balneola sp. MJW-20]|uniref:hypothetical protein n=1 Tax=Gracilimonas aurantiaca TaxID=3234185 RepID=UPI00346778EC